MSKEQSRTEKQQIALGKYCRTGKKPPRTSIEEHTWQYRRLVYSVVNDTLTSAFPNSILLIGKKRWKKAVRFFFENHPCQTPQIWKLPKEFLDFYESNKFPFKKNFPFLSELLLFEWMKIEMFLMEDHSLSDFTQKRKNLNSVIIPNSEIKILVLQYPIHLKNVNEIKKKEKSEYLVSIHRDFFSKEVKIFQLSLLYAQMLIKINESETSTHDLRKMIVSTEENPKLINKAVEDFMKFCLTNTLVLGYKK